MWLQLHRFVSGRLITEHSRDYQSVLGRAEGGSTPSGYSSPAMQADGEDGQKTSGKGKRKTRAKSGRTAKPHAMEGVWKLANDWYLVL